MLKTSAFLDQPARAKQYVRLLWALIWINRDTSALTGFLGVKLLRNGKRKANLA